MYKMRNHYHRQFVISIYHISGGVCSYSLAMMVALDPVPSEVARCINVLADSTTGVALPNLEPDATWR